MRVWRSVGARKGSIFPKKEGAQAKEAITAAALGILDKLGLGALRSLNGLLLQLYSIVIIINFVICPRDPIPAQVD